MFTDLFVIVYWWLILLLAGIFALPLVFGLFSNFWDKGWVFSKTLAIILLSYLLLILGRLHLLPFFHESIFLIVILWLGINALFVDFGRLKKEILSRKEEILLEEGLFLLALIFWSFVRGFQPNIEGLEKFMDFGFVNSILRTKWFPPQDMWFAGEPINYYYFGHLQTAVLTKIAGLDSAVTYNLMMATVFALTFISTFSLTSNLICFLREKTYNIKKTIISAGLISALLLTLGGNLHAAIYALKDGRAKYWYPDATRFIGYRPNNPNDKTIHEFPAYSFVVADLHGHMNDIPTVLLFMAVLITFGAFLRKKGKKIFPTKLIFYLGFLLGIQYMTNSWDFPIYGVLFAIFVFLVLLFSAKSLSVKSLFEALKKLFSYGIFVLLLAVVFSLPFSLSFNPMADGIAFVRAHSLWWQLLILWGFFWFITLGFWIFVIKERKTLNIADIFLIAASVWATVLIIIPEFVYVKDIYIPEYHRANTMFKLVYQSFMIYALSAGYVFVRIRQQFKKFSCLAGRQAIFYILYSIFFLVGFSAHMIYPYFAIKGYYGRLTPSRYQGIYGMNFLKNQSVDDYEGVIWLKKNITGQPVVLEAVGDSYTLYNRVSAMTGLPTVEGWLIHEWLWRGGYDKPGARAAEVGAIYQGEDESNAERLLKKYKTEYVFIGSMEKEKYPSLKEERFSKLGKEVFSSGETKIYQLN